MNLTGVKNGMWVGKNRGDTPLPIYAYIMGTKSYTQYKQDLHKFHFIWPFAEYVIVDGVPTTGVIAYPTTYSFRQREKLLKEQGWHNSGPMVEKNCFLFAKKGEADKFGMKNNSPIKIALAFDGRWFIWIDKGLNEEKVNDQFKMILNILETVL
jgi:hypothetical protein